MPNIDDLRRDREFTARLKGQNLNFKTTWGLFSPEKIDEGTQMLLDEIEVGVGFDCLDLGCGYGPIGLTLAKLAPMGRVHLADKDFVAVEYAKQNAVLNDLDNIEVYLSNGFDQIPKDLQFDLIASNLPAKVSSELLTIWLHDAKARLKPGGRLYVVVIAGLKDYIKRNFQDIFGNYAKAKQGQTHVVAYAEKA